MIKLLLTLIAFTTLYSGAVFSRVPCFIEVYPNMVLFSDKIQDHMNLIKTSTCSYEKRFNFISTLIQLKGKISSNHLAMMLRQDKNDEQLLIVPNSFTIQPISALIQKQIALPANIEVSAYKPVGMRRNLILDRSEKMIISCDRCPLLGQRNVTINILNSSRFKRPLLGFATLLKKIKVLQSKDIVRPFQEGLNKMDLFTTTYSAVEKPDLYFSDFDNLKYYKTNKSLPQKHQLLHSDLIPINLVKPGTIANIIIKQNNLILKTKGMPQRFAHINEEVTLINSKTKKHINGKVTNFNTVLVEL